MEEKLFIREFYQNETSEMYQPYYHSQREAWAVFKTVGLLKHNVYIVKLIDVIPQEDYKISYVVGGNHYQYDKYKYQHFYLRKHKKHYTSWDKILYYFDVRTPGKEQYEYFREITQEQYEDLKTKWKYWQDNKGVFEL